MDCVRVLKPLFEVRRPLAARLRINEVGHSNGPWSFEKRLDFGDEGFPETIERIAESPPRLEEARENAALLRRHGHPLALDRGKAADRVSERDQTAREAVEHVESSPHAAWHPEPRDVADAFCAADRVVDRRHAERLGEGHEPVDVAGRRVAVVCTSETLHRRPSMGAMIPKRLLPGGVGKCSMKSQSVGASSGVSKIAVAEA